MKYPGPHSQYLTISNVKIHYLEAGQGEPILLLHGWPTSAYLYRQMIEPLAVHYHVLAPDLPGFGFSDKPEKASFSLNYYNKIIQKFVATLNIEQLTLVVHDLGGPIGMLWAVRHPKQVKNLVFLNTLIYKDFSWAVVLFTMAVKLPILNNWLASPSGIAFAMKLGVFNKKRLSPEVLAPYTTPFKEQNARKALIKAATNVSLKAFDEIAEGLSKINADVLIIYGAQDKILPNVAKTMAKLNQQFPDAALHALPQCGHFLQEDEPEKISILIHEFLNQSK